MERDAGRVDVLIAGGGVAALEATLALRALAQERVAITLVAPESDFTYRPLAVAEPFRVGEVRRFPLRPLVEAAGAELRRGSVAAVNPDRRVAVAEGGQEELRYEVLLLALGAVAREAVPGALTFRGPEDGPALAGLLERAVEGEFRSLVFALPAGVTWSLPLYELALLTWTYLSDRATTGVELTLVTPEEAPLGIFGARAIEAIHGLLETREIALRTQATPLHFEEGVLTLTPAAQIETEAVVALPRLEGPRLAGIPCDPNGFVPTDDFGRVGSEVDVYAAGDLTQFPLKQGGIAAQQADVAAASIAARVGAEVEPTPFRPVLRGLLLTGTVPRYLRAKPGTADSAVDTEPLWWPPAKIVGRHLAPFLAARLGLPDTPPRTGAEDVSVEVDLSPREHSPRAAEEPYGSSDR
jgi:sulfide:quinone oxidoreductase